MKQLQRAQNHPCFDLYAVILGQRWLTCGIAIRLPSYKNCCECFWNEPFCTQGALAYTHLMKQLNLMMVL